MAELVYILCAVTSLTCSVMLWRGYRASRVRLLLWSTLCFVGIGMSNAFLVVDLMLLPAFDLSVVRTIPSLAGIMVLIYGLVWDAN
jgi:hypothetical protein